MLLIISTLQPQAIPRALCLPPPSRANRGAGVLLLPTTPAAAAAYTQLLGDGALRKLYLARARGWVRPRSVEVVDVPIRTTSEAGATWHECAPAGTPPCPRAKPARTIVFSLGHDAASDSTLLLCQLETGRPHQVRLHLQHIRHPVGNDPLYSHAPGCNEGRSAHTDTPCVQGIAAGSCSSGDGADAACVDVTGESGSDSPIWLHAWRYSCDHPSRTFSVQAPLPQWVSTFAPLVGVKEALEVLQTAASAQVHCAVGELEPSANANAAASQPNESDEAQAKKLKAEAPAPAVSAPSRLTRLL